MPMERNNDKLRIAMLGHKRIPSREGGVEIVVEQLSTRIAAQNHQVTCFNRSGNHIGGKEFQTQQTGNYNGVTIRPVLTIDKKGLAAMTSSFFAAARAAVGTYDVVHFHAEGPCAMLWLPKLFGKKCVATVHGLDWQRDKWKGGFGVRYIKFGERVAVGLADEIIVLSRQMQTYFDHTYGRHTTFISNGVTRPEKVEARQIQEQFGLQKDGYILFLGRIVPEKGLENLIKAYKAVDTEKKLVIAGSASDTQQFLQQLKQSAAEDPRILFTGFVQGRILEELYSNAYVYVLPSQLEGMPLSLLEAMSYGNCCLTSDIPECTEVVEDKAVTFERNNVRDLIQKLQMLCDNRDLVESYKEEAADFVCGKYSWDETAQRTIALYTKPRRHHENSDDQ